MPPPTRLKKDPNQRRSEKNTSVVGVGKATVTSEHLKLDKPVRELPGASVTNVSSVKHRIARFGSEDHGTGQPDPQ